MKKNFLGILLAALVIIIGVFSLVACNNNDNVDKATNNKDFVEYRKKIVTVLKDNGIFVNDFDAVTLTASSPDIPNLKLTTVTPTADGTQNTIDDIMVNDAYAANRSDYEFALKQVFGMSLKMSLCLGDGISNYFGETSFFDIPVFLSGSYISVSQSGDVSTVRSYSPYSEGSDVFETIKLDFKSASNYSFTVTSINNGFMYAAGNAQKQFLMMDNSEVTYSPDGTNFYRTDDKQTVESCIALLDDGIFEFDVDEFYALKTNVRYTFNESQVSALFDKYFKDIQSSVGKIEGIQYMTVGGIRFADSYVAVHNETEVEITPGTEYISDDFTVYDDSGTVTSLYIPNSVKGIVQLSDPKSGQLYETPKIISNGINSDIFTLHFAEEGQDFEKVFKRISVENGSPIFKSGIGHLQTLDGDYLYVADIAFKELSTSLFCENVIMQINAGRLYGYYSNLFSQINTLDLDINEDYFNKEFGFRAFWQELSSFFYALERVTIHGVCENNDGLFVDFTVSKDLTVDISLDGEWEQRDSKNSLMFRSYDGQSHNVVINLNGFSRLQAVNTDGVKATLNVELAEVLYVCYDIIRPVGDSGVTIKYADKDMTEEQKQLSYQRHNRSGKTEIMAAVETKDAKGGIVIPDSIGIDVTALMLYESDSLEYVQFGSYIKYLIFNYDYNNDISYTVKFDGDYADFEKVQIICYGTSYSFNLECNDRQQYISGEKTIPQDEQCTITVKYKNEMGVYSTLVLEQAKNRDVRYISSELMRGGEYIIINSESIQVGEASISSTNPNDIYNFGIFISKEFITGDLTFTIIEAPEHTEQNVKLTADGFSLTGVFDGWVMINDVSLSIRFDGYTYEDNGTYIIFNESGIFDSGVILYGSQIAKFTISLRIADGKYIIVLESFTVETAQNQK